MSVAALVTIGVSLFAALCCSWLLIAPFLKEEEVANDDAHFRDLERVERKEQLFVALQELEQEFLSGKLPEEYYRASKQELTAELSQLLAGGEPKKEANGTPRA